MPISFEQYIKNNYDKSFNISEVPFSIKKRSYKKGETIYPYGYTGKNMYFLSSGIVETTVMFGEIEKTLSFILEGMFFGPFASILLNNQSTIQGVAISDCEIYEFNYHKYQQLCKVSLLANQVGKTEVEKYYLNKFQRESDFLTKTTEEVYIAMLNQSPELIQQIPLKKIANYLGILPETLSRIRKRSIS